MSADAIAIVSPDACWASAFAAEEKRIRRALGERALRIDHVGSTSVPDLAAKPVIDIQVSVALLHPMEPWRTALETIEYQHVPHPDDVRYPFLHRPASWPHTHHIHVCTAGSPTESAHLAFRDYLRDHPQTAREYERLKRELAAVHSAANMEARNAYSNAKSSFIRPLVERALASGYPH